MKIDKIIRTKRKTIAIQIAENATLVVRAPLRVSDKTIQEIVNQHTKWIERKIEQMKARKLKYVPKKFIEGEEFLYLGKCYKLHVVDDQKSELRFENGFYLSKNALSCARDLFVEWYKRAAYEHILQRVQYYTKLIGLQYNRIKITSAKKTFGSCAGKNLDFSWRLVMAPLPVIDYIVVHEVLHLEEKNHSKRFWHRVQTLMPEYEKHRVWLKQNYFSLIL